MLFILCSWVTSAWTLHHKNVTAFCWSTSGRPQLQLCAHMAFNAEHSKLQLTGAWQRRGKKTQTEAYIRVRQARGTNCRKASDFNSWLFPHLLCYSTACHPAFIEKQLYFSEYRRKICTIKLFAANSLFPVQRSRTFPSSKSAFTLLLSKTHRPALITHLWYPFYSQPVRTHSSLPLWWLALAKERSHLPLLKSG